MQIKGGKGSGKDRQEKNNQERWEKEMQGRITKIKGGVERS